MWLIWLGSAWLAGIALGLDRDPGWWPLALWGGLTLLALALLYPEWQRSFSIGLLLLGALSLGAWRAGLVHAPLADLPPGEIEAVRGRVVGWPTRGDQTDTAILVVEAVRIASVWQGGTAQMRVEVPPAPALGRGDLVELYGYYRPTAAIPLVGFRTYLERRGLHGQFRAFSVRVQATGQRDDLSAWRVAALTNVEEGVRRHVPGAEGALVTGILLGDDHLLPRSDRDAFAATSTAHVMALSGWNIALIAALCALVGRRLRYGRSLLWLGGSALAIWGFVFFVGGGATLVRAAIMGTLYLGAEAVGRRGDALTALAASAIVMTALAPGTILDIGFQLSCAATFGLIVAAWRIKGLLVRWRLPQGVAEVVAATLTAELFTLPLILHHFGRISTVTLPTNVLIEPAVPLIMAGGTITALTAFVSGPLADFVGLLTWVPARVLLWVVESLAALPWVAWRAGAPSWPVVALLYGMLALALRASDWFSLVRAGGRGVLVTQRPLLLSLGAGLVGGLVVVGWLLVLLP